MRPTAEPPVVAADPVNEAIAAYGAEVDREILRGNLALPHEERFLQLMEMQAFAGELRRRSRREGAGGMDYGAALRALVDSGVRFIIVGGAAATAHGSARLTHDLDILYARNLPNLDRLARALGPHAPALRDADPTVPFQLHADALAQGANLSLSTALGDLDLHGELPGGGSYDDLLPHAIEIELFALRCRCLDLPALIAIKRAAGPDRTEDLEAMAELAVLLEERETASTDTRSRSHSGT